MADANSIRVCKACGLEKPLAEFHPNPHKNYKCSPCLKEYKRQIYLKSRDDVIRRTRERYWSDPDRSRAISRERAKRDPNARARKESYKERHRDRVLAQARDYRSRNQDACNARVAAWGERNKHIRALWAAQRRAMKLTATPKWADGDALDAVYRLAQKLTEESGVCHEVDHIVPLKSENVCGLHCEANLRVISLEANRSKGNRHWPDMWEPL